MYMQKWQLQIEGGTSKRFSLRQPPDRSPQSQQSINWWTWSKSSVSWIVGRPYFKSSNCLDSLWNCVIEYLISLRGARRHRQIWFYCWARQTWSKHLQPGRLWKWIGWIFSRFWWFLEARSSPKYNWNLQQCYTWVTRPIMPAAACNLPLHWWRILCSNY